MSRLTPSISGLSNWKEGIVPQDFSLAFHALSFSGFPPSPVHIFFLVVCGLLVTMPSQSVYKVHFFPWVS